MSDGSTPARDPGEAVLFAARLHPHRSLSPAQVRRLLVGIGIFSFVATLPFVIMGAWPVAGFMGLDVLGLAIAFGASFRAARAFEDVRLTTFDLELAKVNPRGLRAEWHFNPSWVRLERIAHAEFGTIRLNVVSRGSRIEVAPFLGPDQKAALADNLSRALVTAKRGIRYS